MSFTVQDIEVRIYRNVSDDGKHITYSARLAQGVVLYGEETKPANTIPEALRQVGNELVAANERREWRRKHDVD